MAAREASGLVRLGKLNVYIAAAESGDPGAVLIPKRGAAKPVAYASLYEALRSRMEIMRRYGALRRTEGSELDGLSALRGGLRETHVALASGDDGGADGTFAATAGALGRKRNVFKKEARVKAEAGVVRHPPGGVNRGATRARLSAIDRRLSLREDEVRSIAPWIGAMETALLIEIRRCEGIVRDLDRCAGAMSGHELVRKGDTSPRQRKAIAARLSLTAEPLATLVGKPFIGVREALAAPVLRAVVSADNGTGEEFAEAVRELLAVTGSSIARSAIEGILILMVAGPTPGQLVRSAEKGCRDALRAYRGSGADTKAADTLAARLRLACQALREGSPEAAKPYLKEAIAGLQNPA